MTKVRIEVWFQGKVKANLQVNSKRKNHLLKANLLEVQVQKVIHMSEISIRKMGRKNDPKPINYRKSCEIKRKRDTKLSRKTSEILQINL